MILGCTNGELIFSTLRVSDWLILGIDEGNEMGYFIGSFHGSNYRKIEDS